MQPTPLPPHETRFRNLLVVALLAMGAIGASAYFAGRLQGQAEASYQATLRVEVQNRFATDQTFQVLVNNKVRASISISAGQTGSVDLLVNFSPADGAIFDVEAVMGTYHDSNSVLVNSPGTYVVALSLPPG